MLPSFKLGKTTMSNPKHTIILGKMWSHPPIDLEDRLARKGLGDVYSCNIMDKLFRRVEFRRQVFVKTITDEDGNAIDIYSYEGTTCEITIKKLAGTQMSPRQASRTISNLVKEGFLTTSKGDNANIYHIRIYDDLIEEFRAMEVVPARLQKLFTLPVDLATHDTRAAEMISDDALQDDSDSSLTNVGDDCESSNLDINNDNPPQKILGTSTGKELPTPPPEGEEREVQENSQKQEMPSTDIEEKKNSQSAKTVLPASTPAATDLSLSPKLLAQKFHELFGPEEPTEKLLAVSSDDFFRRAADGSHTGILMDLMKDQRLRERFPDSSVRAHACVAVVRRAFKILRKTSDEWGEIKSPRFLNTLTGQRAISKARTEFCRPSLVVDEPSETEPISMALASFNSEPEPSEESSAADEPKQSAFSLKNPKAKAWQRDHVGKPLDPDIQAILDRMESGTPPDGMDDTPSYKKAKLLRGAK